MKSLGAEKGTEKKRTHVLRHHSSTAAVMPAVTRLTSRFMMLKHDANQIQNYLKKKTVKIAKLVVNEELKSFNCRITSHSKSYFCLLFSYSKPILSVEGEETMIVEKWQTLAGLSHHKPLKVRK